MRRNLRPHRIRVCLLFVRNIPPFLRSSLRSDGRQTPLPWFDPRGGESPTTLIARVRADYARARAHGKCVRTLYFVDVYLFLFFVMCLCDCTALLVTALARWRILFAIWREPGKRSAAVIGSNDKIYYLFLANIYFFCISLSCR